MLENYAYSVNQHYAASDKNDGLMTTPFFLKHLIGLVHIW